MSEQFPESPKERIENPAEAEVAAYAEKPAKDWIAENRDKLSEEQLKALEWFTTEEGEKALAEYSEDKDETKRLIEEKAFSFFDLSSEVYEEEQKEAVEQVTRQLMQTTVQERLQGELQSTAEKLDYIRNTAIRFRNGFGEIKRRNNPYAVVSAAERLKEEVDRKYAGYEMRGGQRYPLKTDMGSNYASEYLKGALAAALVLEQRDDIHAILNRLVQLSDRPQELLEPILSHLVPYHKDRDIDELLENNGYIFNSKNNTYRRVETK